MKARTSSKNILSSAQKIAALKEKVNILEEQLALLQEQYDWLKNQVFGRKTEQTSVITEGGTQLSLFQDEKEQAVSALEEENMVTVPEHKRKPKRKHDDWMSNLPIKEEIHEEENPVCEKCGSEMEEIGEEKVYDELVYVPGEFYVRRHFVKSLFSIFLHASLWQIFPITASNGLAIRQYYCTRFPCNRKNYAHESAHTKILNRLYEIQMHSMRSGSGKGCTES